MKRVHRRRRDVRSTVRERHDGARKTQEQRPPKASKAPVVRAFEKPSHVVTKVPSHIGHKLSLTACNSGSTIGKESKMTLISVKIFYRVYFHERVLKKEFE